MFGSQFYVVEMKGTKGYTKTVDSDDLGGSMNGSIEQLKIEFPFLDWDYMQDPTKGELVCDVGITFHPQGNEPLVGLWKLDQLEASFGAGGYLQGDLHRVNTLSDYGGLQAEQSIQRKERAHVIFRSAYNIAYEVTRKMNNQRDVFQEKDVFDLTDGYLKEVRKVILLYREHASRISYGVRDEIRIGGRALGQLMDTLDQMVRGFLITLGN
jgi:hypothetical protein